jgi:hypothetical protein
MIFFFEAKVCICERACKKKHVHMGFSFSFIMGAHDAANAPLKRTMILNDFRLFRRKNPHAQI